MYRLTLLLLLTYFFPPLLPLVAQPPQSSSTITLVGVVYCDVCSTNTYSRHSYFLSGVEVHIQCKFKADAPKTTEQIILSVNRTTDRYGVYKLDIPSVDGVDCINGLVMESMCLAKLIGSSSFSTCNVPALKITSNHITVKSKQDNQCLYSLNALTYRPLERNATLCAYQKEVLANSSKFFLPFFPPFGLPFPNLPPTPFMPFPFPFPFPPITFSTPPSLPFPFPPLPPFPPPPPPPPPPTTSGFNLSDPRTWIPPPAFNLGDPRTWFPNIPPSPPHAYDLKEPVSFIPQSPISLTSQDQQP